MPNIYISVISHHNDQDIIHNTNLKKISRLENTFVLIRDNVRSPLLEAYCIKNSFHYSFSKTQLGFGENNNKNFEGAYKLGMTQDDWFVLINPDVDIDPAMIVRLSELINFNGGRIFAINLFTDKYFCKMEQSLRKYPSISSFFNVITGKSFTESYKKECLEDYARVDWAAGSFLVFKVCLFDRLKGFDEKYFMYFEDVDICYRANKTFSEKVVYLKDIHAVHRGGYQNRKLLSPHFRWYFKSLIRFLFKIYLRKS